MDWGLGFSQFRGLSLAACRMRLDAYVLLGSKSLPLCLELSISAIV